MKFSALLALGLLCGNAYAGGNIPFMFVPPTGNQIYWTGASSPANANWSDPTNWSSNAVPLLNETALFNNRCVPSNCSPTMDVSVVVGSIYMDTTYTGTISQMGRSLNVGAFTVAGGTYDSGSGTLTVSAVFTQNGGTFLAGSGTKTFNAYTTRFQGGTFDGGTATMTFQNPQFTGGNFKASSGTTTCVNGFAVNAGAVFDPNNGTWVLSPTTAGTSAGAYYVVYPADYTNIEFNILKFKSTATWQSFNVFGGALRAKHFTIDGFDSTTTLNNNRMMISGNVTVLGQGATGTSLITLTSTGAQAVDGSSAATPSMPGIDITGNGSTITFSGNPRLNANSFCATGNTNTINGALTLTRGLSASCSLLGNSALSFTGTTAATLSAAGSMPTGLFTVNKSATTLTLGTNVALTGPSQAMTVTNGTVLVSGKTLNVSGTLTINTGATVTRGTGGTVTYGALAGGGTLN